MPRVFIGVGSNIDPERHISSALARLATLVTLTGLSTFYRTAPLERPEQSAFINGVVMGETALPPLALKYDVLRRIEGEHGRVRTGDSYAPRTIDLDLLLYDMLVVESELLILPDPDIRHRPFIACPLAELAADMCLPGEVRPMSEICAVLIRAEMTPLSMFTAQLKADVL